MEKDGACKLEDKIKNVAVLERKIGRIENNAGSDKQVAGPLAKKKLPAEGCYGRYGKWEESSRQRKISDDRQHYDK